MKRIHFNSRFFIVVLMSLLAAVATSAQTADNDPAKDFYRLTKAAPAAFSSGDYWKAKAFSLSLLKEAESWKDNWNYGNAVHAANLVLGRVALVNGDVDDAKEFLLAAGKTPGSPQLNSFGPDMLFAKEMLKRGESETVIQYLDLCAKFWEKRSAILEAWKASIQKNEEPDFGANLRYFFPEQFPTVR